MLILSPSNWVTLARFPTVVTTVFPDYSLRLVRTLCGQALLLWSSTERSEKEETQLFVHWNLWDCDKLFL